MQPSVNSHVPISNNIRCTILFVTVRFIEFEIGIELFYKCGLVYFIYGLCLLIDFRKQVVLFMYFYASLNIIVEVFSKGL